MTRRDVIQGIFESMRRNQNNNYTFSHILAYEPSLRLGKSKIETKRRNIVDSNMTLTFVLFH